eukprot:1128710-Prymnesium_polylepis.1
MTAVRAAAAHAVCRHAAEEPPAHRFVLACSGHEQHQRIVPHAPAALLRPPALCSVAPLPGPDPV